MIFHTFVFLSVERSEFFFFFSNENLRARFLGIETEFFLEMKSESSAG